jgi:hypothetical protein
MSTMLSEESRSFSDPALPCLSARQDTVAHQPTADPIGRYHLRLPDAATTTASTPTSSQPPIVYSTIRLERWSRAELIEFVRGCAFEGAESPNLLFFDSLVCALKNYVGRKWSGRRLVSHWTSLSAGDFVNAIHQEFCGDLDLSMCRFAATEPSELPT